MEIRTLVPAGEANAFKTGNLQGNRTLADLDGRHRALIDGPVTAAMVTYNSDGSANLTPVWVGADDTHLLVNSVRGRLKDRNLRARPQVNLLFVDPADSYHWVSIAGEVDEVIEEDDPQRGHEATRTINAFSALYLGQDVYPLRDPENEEIRVLYRVAPKKLTVFG